VLDSNHAELSAMRYWQAVNFLDSYCAQHQIPLLQINVASPTRPISVTSLCNYKTGMVELLQQEADFTKKILHAPGKHPNSAGAEYLANLLVEQIYKRKLLND